MSKRQEVTPDAEEMVATVEELVARLDRMFSSIEPNRTPTSADTGVDLDTLRENLRLHLLERAQGEFDNPRPHQYAYSNELLDELVRIRPRTKNALRSINGMGPWRMESSGDILRIIDEWLMRRCVHSIQSNMEVLAVTSEMEVSVTPEVLDAISEHFAEWTRGRDEPPKRISTAEAKQEILDVMDSLWSEKTEKARVSELRDGLADRDMVFSPSRLSQIITSMVNDDLIVRKRPVPYEKGVVILEFTEKGLAESLQEVVQGYQQAEEEFSRVDGRGRNANAVVRQLVREICVERGGKAHLDEICSRAESTNVPETTVYEVLERMLITGELSFANDAKDVYQFPRQS